MFAVVVRCRLLGSRQCQAPIADFLNTDVVHSQVTLYLGGIIQAEKTMINGSLYFLIVVYRQFIKK